MLFADTLNMLHRFDEVCIIKLLMMVSYGLHDAEYKIITACLLQCGAMLNKQSLQQFAL